MSKIFSSSISTPNKNISTILFFRNFRFFSLVFFSLLIVISCGDTTAASGDDEDTGDGGTGNTGTVNSVTIDGTAPYMVTVGETTLNLTATVLVTGGAAETVTWSSADDAIATVDANSGEVTGVAAGGVDITATSTVDTTKTATVTITVRVPVGIGNGVTIDDKTTKTLVAGSDLQLSATVTVSNGAATTVEWSSDDDAIATVDTSGKVTGITGGEVTITATATDDSEKKDSLLLTITAKPIGTMSYTTQTVTVGSALTAISPSHNVQGVTATYTVTAGTLPAGVSIAPETGIISGTPSKIETNTVTITATGIVEYAGETTTATVIIAVSAKPITGFTYSDATQSVAVGNPIAPLVATIAPAGATVTYAVPAGTLPTGLTLANDGGISGTITTQGVYSFTVTATGTGDYAGETQTADVKITVNSKPITGFTYSDATQTVVVGNPITALVATITPAGATVTYAVPAGTLPTGLTLANDGGISGTITTQGVYSFTVTVTGTGDYAGETQTADVKITVNSKPITGFTYSDATQTVAAGNPITALVATITPAGATVTYAVPAGALPTGLILANDGGISGTINTKGNYDFTVTATGTGEYAGETQTADVTITIPNRAPAFTSGATASAIAENSGAGQTVYTAVATDVDGDTITYSLGAGKDGASFTINGATGAVTLTANPDFETKSSYAFDVIASDGSLDDTIGVTLSITDVAAGIVTSVTIDGTAPYAVNLEGTPLELTATVAVEGGTATVTWSSADTAIATVDTTGKVTGVALGNVDITATSTADATKTDKVTVTVEPPAPATAIMDTAVANVNNVQRNYYFLVNVTADATDKLKLVVKESSLPAPTAAEIKAGAGQTKTLGTTAKTVMFSYPIDSKIGNYKGAPQGHYIHTASSNIDGLFLKPSTAYTIYATAPDDTGAVLTGGSYTPPAFDVSKPMMDMSSTVSGVKYGLYDESLFASTLSIHIDDPLFILPIVMTSSTTVRSGMDMFLIQNGDIKMNADMDTSAYDFYGPAKGLFFLSSYYDSTQAVPHRFVAGTGTIVAQRASFSFYFNDPSTAKGTWSVRAQYKSKTYEDQPNTLTITEED